VEGRPEPTSLPPKKTASAPPSLNASLPTGSKDANGMERMAGESDQQYVDRQTRLREEARVRMQSKFGGSGMRGSGMQGVGSDPNYNPGGGGGMDLVSGVSSAFSTGLSFMGGAANSVASSVTSVVQDESTKASISNLGNTAMDYGGSFWGSLSTSVNSLAQPGSADDGLADLQRQFSSNRPSQSKYGGFGSDSATGGTSNNRSSQPTMSSTATSVAGEAPGMPGEDRNGIERLAGENDEQYVTRQTRLRDEAKARMAAKFGGGGLSSASSSASPYRPAPAPASGGFGGVTPSPASGGFSAAPRSGGLAPAPRSGGLTPPRKNSSDVDFFSSFGT
jgi:hypothetical protein